MAPVTMIVVLAAVACSLLGAVTTVEAETAAELVPGFKSEKCPAFQSGACTFAKCYGNPGYLQKFQTYELLKDKTGTVALTSQGSNTLVSYAYMTSQSDCCWKCANTVGCAYWQWIPYLKKPCYLVSPTIEKVCQAPTITYGTSKEAKSRQVLIGGKCNPGGKVTNDPHFEGARGTQYDFNGEPNRSFCLLTDSHLHINIKLTGYFDNRTEGATLLKNGKAVRTWIKEVGMLWREGGVEHTLRLGARSGKQQERGNGFLSLIEVDGKALALPKLDETLSAAGGLVLKFVALEKTGPFDVDYYTLKIGDLVDLDLRLRIAHPMLQAVDDAEVHFNIGINEIKQTEAIHGVLGQTYRADHEQRAVDFSQLSALLHKPIQADGESGKGFLDGASHDYVTSAVLKPDCFFSAYAEHSSVASE